MKTGHTIAQLLCLLAALLSANSVVAQKNNTPNSEVDVPAFSRVDLDSLLLTEPQRTMLVSTRMRMQARAKNPSLFNLDPSLSSLETPTLAPLLNASMAINGVVVRSNKQSIVWINGQAYSSASDSTPIKALALQAGLPAAPLAVSGQIAKAGETIDLPSGERQDLLPAGSIVIIKPQVGSPQKSTKE
jgi:hypothetical protein